MISVVSTLAPRFCASSTMKASAELPRVKSATQRSAKRKRPSKAASEIRAGARAAVFAVATSRSPHASKPTASASGIMESQASVVKVARSNCASRCWLQKTTAMAISSPMKAPSVSAAR